MAQGIFIPIADNERLSAILIKGREPDGVTKPIFDATLETGDPVRSKTMVMMIHGFPGNKETHNDIFGDLEFRIAQDDFHTLRFDFRGCGASEGRFEDFSFKSATQDIESILGWARSFGYERFFFIAEGLGATLALQNLTPDVRGAVLLWPALDPRHTHLKEPLAAVEAGRANGFVEWQGRRVGVPFLEELKAFNPVRNLKKIRVPLLIQHGADDPEIPPSQLELLRRHGRNMKRIEMTVYEGGGAGLRRLNERQTMLYHIRQFLKRYA
jgi:pimeloyl-ACP methyl ester carboxylesterase